MNVSMARASVLLALGLGLAASPSAYAQGSVRGKVVDAHGRAIVGAQLHASKDGEVSASAIQYVTSSDKGEFLISNLPLGSYRIFGKKEDEGYGDNSFEFYSDHLPPHVQITTEAADVEVTVVLGPKGAILSGTIVEDASGRPRVASAILRKTKDPSKPIGIEVNANFRILIPAGEDISIKLVSADHESWTNEGAPLHLEPGTTKVINVRLRRM